MKGTRKLRKFFSETRSFGISKVSFSEDYVTFNKLQSRAGNSAHKYPLELDQFSHLGLVLVRYESYRMKNRLLLTFLLGCFTVCWQLLAAFLYNLYSKFIK